MAKNKTIYVNDEDQQVWEDARRFLLVHHDESLSAYLTKCLKQLLAGKKNEKDNLHNRRRGNSGR